MRLVQQLLHMSCLLLPAADVQYSTLHINWQPLASATPPSAPAALHAPSATAGTAATACSSPLRWRPEGLRRIQARGAPEGSRLPPAGPAAARPAAAPAVHARERIMNKTAIH